MFSENVEKTKFFLEAVNQLKNTSDCIKIDPPGPERNLEQRQKSQKNNLKFWTFFHSFTVKTPVFWGCTPSGRALKGKPLKGKTLSASP